MLGTNEIRLGAGRLLRGRVAIRRIVFGHRVVRPRAGRWKVRSAVSVVRRRCTVAPTAITRIGGIVVLAAALAVRVIAIRLLGVGTAVAVALLAPAAVIGLLVLRLLVLRVLVVGLAVLRLRIPGIGVLL